MLVRVPSGERKAPVGGDYVHRFQRIDNDSVIKHQNPGGGFLTGIYSEELETKWVGVNTILEFPIEDTTTSFQAIGGWASSFCGVDRILNGVSDGAVNFTLNAGDRPGYIMIQFPVKQTVSGITIPSTILAFEIIKIDSITFDLNEGHPAVDGDDDLVGMPIRLTFNVAAGGRGQFFTSALDFPKNSLITDLTIPVQFIERRMTRLVDGLPVFNFDVGLEQADLELGDLVALPGQDIFLAEGEDGLSGVEKLEIIEKTLRLITDDAGTSFKVAPIEAPALTNIDDAFDTIRDHLGDVLNGPWNTDDAPWWDQYTPGGLELSDPGGGFISIRRGSAVGPFGNIEVFSPGGIPDIPTVASEDTYIYYDTHGRYFHRLRTAVGAGQPVAVSIQTTVGKIETDGANAHVGIPTDLRVVGRMMATPEGMPPVGSRILNAAFALQVRNSDRYPPDGFEMFPMDAVWGAPGAVGNDAELFAGDANIKVGDSAIKVLTPGLGVKTSIFPVDPDYDYMGNFRWGGTAAGGTGEGRVVFFAQDKTTVVQSTLIVNKLPANPGGVSETDRLVLSPPSTARWCELRFVKGLIGAPSFAFVDRMSLERMKDGFHTTISANQSITSGVFTKILWSGIDTVIATATGTFVHNWGQRFTVFTIFTPGSPFLTPREDAEWEFEGHIEMESDNRDYNTFVGLFVNGILRKETQILHATSASGTTGTPFMFRVVLNQADVVDIRVKHNNFASLSVIGDPIRTFWSGRQVDAI